MVNKDQANANEALEAEVEYKTAVEEAYDYVENFDILETITNVGNDEVFTPRKTADMMLDALPEEVWHNANYKWLNPATKNGIFEREIAIRLDKGLAEVIPDVEARRKHILQNMIFSIGQTKFTSNVARRTVYYCSQANRECDGIKASDGHFVNGYAIGNGSWFNDEEGNIKTPCTDHHYVDAGGKKMPNECAGDERKRYRCKYCGISATSNYNDANQREKYAYEFIHVNKNDLMYHLQNRFFKGDRKMKFDIIIGNPPYQLNDGGNGASATPIYHLFINQAIELHPKYLSMIIPARWYAGGKGLDDFRIMMLQNKHIQKLVDYNNSADCFPVVNIAGGVCFFLWNSSYTGACSVTNMKNGEIDSVDSRYLGEYEYFVRDNHAVPIIRKVLSAEEPLMSKTVFPRNYFSLPTTIKGNATSFEGAISVNSSKGVIYVDKSEIQDVQHILDKYKVITTYAMSGGNKPSSDGRYQILSSLQILGPGEACSETYLILDVFDDKAGAEQLVKYMSGKLARFLLLQALTSIHITKDKFCFVPRQPINQDVSDVALCDKYSLSCEEQQLIDKTIKTAGLGG